MNWLDGPYVSKETFKTILNSIDSGIVITDALNLVTFANTRAVSLLNTGNDVILGSNFRSFMEEIFAPGVSNPQELYQWLEIVDAVSNVPVEDLRLDCELEYTDAPRQTRFLNLLAIPVRHISRNEPANIVIIYDVSDLRRTEQVLKLVSDAVREMNVDLRVDRMLGRLSKIAGQRMCVDGMAILWTSSHDDNGGIIFGAIPEMFLGGEGARGLLVDNKPIGEEFLFDIVTDVEKSLEKARAYEEQIDSVFTTAFLEKLHNAGMQSFIALPLRLFGGMLGIWVIAGKQPKSYDHSDVTFLQPVSEHLAVAVNNAVLLHRTRSMYSAAVRALAATVDIRDTYTMNHSENVARISKVIALEMGLSKEEIEIIELAGLVHDIGKVGIPDTILNKPGSLTPSEMAIMINHSILGANILERAGMLADLAPMVLHHHEWHNGSGYPAKLRGGQIPIGAAILSVADAFDTMISDRVYKDAMSLESARDEIRRCAGGQFDPDVVKALDDAIEKALSDLDGQGGWLLNILQARGLNPGQGIAASGPRTLAEQREISQEAITSKELSVMFRITQEMRKLLDLNDLLDHILYIISTEMHYSDCAILLVDQAGENLVLSAGIGMSKNVLGFKIPKGTGVSWWVMKYGRPQNVPDVGIDERYYEGTPGVASEVYVPLEVRGKRLGVLLVQRAEKYGFTPTDVRLLMAVAGHIASALEVAQLHEQVKKAAETDSLTGLYNRRSTVSALDKMIADSKSEKVRGRIAIALLDVDGLKQVNDNYGHLAGDKVLVHIANHLSQGFRPDDVVGRFGGDEFIVLLPGVSRELATGRVEAVISNWCEARLKDSSGKDIPIPSASFGISCFPIDGAETRILMAQADNRLLAAKSRTHARLR